MRISMFCAALIYYFFDLFVQTETRKKGLCCCYLKPIVSWARLRRRKTHLCKHQPSRRGLLRSSRLLPRLSRVARICSGRREQRQRGETHPRRYLWHNTAKLRADKASADLGVYFTAQRSCLLMKIKNIFYRALTCLAQRYNSASIVKVFTIQERNFPANTHGKINFGTKVSGIFLNFLSSRSVKIPLVVSNPLPPLPASSVGNVEGYVHFSGYC